MGVSVGILSLMLVLLYVGQMHDPLTDEDKVYAEKFLTENHVQPPHTNLTYSEQLAFVTQVQKAVVKYHYSDNGIPYNHPRNIKDYYENPYGLCYDKSHAIEKILQVYGFETRHISIYYYRNFFERMFGFFIPNSESHAASEVKTLKGWMYIDSIVPYLGLYNNMPVNISAVRSLIQQEKVDYEGLGPYRFGGHFNFMYGMYSRNGRLYPPYSIIPDYNFYELSYNLHD